MKNKISIIGGRIPLTIFTYKEYFAYEMIKQKKNLNNHNYVCEEVAKYNYWNNKDIINNEHDKIFRKILDNKSEATKFINKTLKLKYKLKVDDIEKYNSSFVTQELKNQESDIIYKMKNKNIFFLIEHQTKIDYTMPLRILEYEYQIIKSALDINKMQQKGYKFPKVISIVLYSGKKKWNAKTYIEEVQEKLEGYEEISLARYNIVDVNDFTEEELLKDESFLSKAMLIEKRSQTESLGIYMQKIVEEMNRKNSVYTKEQKELLITIIELLLKRKIGNDLANKLIIKLKGEENEDMLAALERIDEENRRILRTGERRGIKKGKLETAKRMLEKNVPIEDIIEFTGLKEKEIINMNK